MHEVVLDANVIVAWLDEADTLAQATHDLMRRLKADASNLVLVDIAVSEALSVLCRRARQRRSSPPDLSAAITAMRGWFEQNAIRPTWREQERLFPDVLALVEQTGGALNFNDALLVVLQREGMMIGDLASFDTGFDAIPDFSRLS